MSSRNLFAGLFVAICAFVLTPSEHAFTELTDTAASRLYGGTPIYYNCYHEPTVDPGWKWCIPACSDNISSYAKPGTSHKAVGGYVACKLIAPTCGSHRTNLEYPCW